MDLRELLDEHGYPVIDGGSYISTKAIFRGGDNPTALCIYEKDNLVIDFPNNERYDIKTLVGRITGIEDKAKVEEYIDEKNISILPSQTDIGHKLIEAPKKLHKKILDELKPIYQYWIERGIDENILKQLEGGIRNGRYYFIIRDSGSFVGFTARDITGNSKVKWLHKGKKTDWIWPPMHSIKEKREVYLVESPGDALSLMTCGFKNVLCLFGLDCSWKIVNMLLRIPSIRINISLNGDSAGVNGSEKIISRLLRYFDSDQICVILPEAGKDWNSILMENGGREKILSMLKK